MQGQLKYQIRINKSLTRITLMFTRHLTEICSRKIEKHHQLTKSPEIYLLNRLATTSNQTLDIQN